DVRNGKQRAPVLLSTIPVRIVEVLAPMAGTRPGQSEPLSLGQLVFREEEWTERLLLDRPFFDSGDWIVVGTARVGILRCHPKRTAGDQDEDEAGTLVQYELSVGVACGRFESLAGRQMRKLPEARIRIDADRQEAELRLDRRAVRPVQSVAVLVAL